MVQKMRPTSRRTPGGSEGLEERRCLWLSKNLSKKHRYEMMDKILENRKRDSGGLLGQCCSHRNERLVASSTVHQNSRSRIAPAD